MLAHAGTDRDAKLLAQLNASGLAGCLPPVWKEAYIQPIPKPREPTKLKPISLSSSVLPKQLRRWCWLGCSGEMDLCIKMCSASPAA